MEENTFELNESGTVNISDEVVTIIASLAASEVKGVSGMVNTLSGGFAEFLGKKNLSKGVKVSVENNKAVLDLYIIVEYGVKIPDVAWNIQEKVKSEVEAMTGLEVEAVNVNVAGIDVAKAAEKENKETEPAEEETAEGASVETENSGTADTAETEEEEQEEQEEQEENS